MYMLLFFCFKQKTAYEMRISDWSSDVCSSDLLRRAASAQVDEARRALGQIDRKIAKLVSAITDGGPAKALTAAIQKLEAEQDALQALLDSADAPVPPLIHPNLALVYRHKVAQLRERLADPLTKAAAAEIIRSLVEAIVLTPTDGRLAIDMRGELAGILALCAGGRQQKAPADRSAEAVQIKVVAGAGFGSAAFGL